MTKEFDRLMTAQEALRLWYKEHPGHEAPEFMRNELEAAQKAYDKAREKPQARG